MIVEFESSIVGSLLTEYLRMGENGGSPEGEQRETSHKPSIQKPLRQAEQFITAKVVRTNVFSNLYYP